MFEEQQLALVDGTSPLPTTSKHHNKTPSLHNIPVIPISSILAQVMCRLGSIIYSKLMDDIDTTLLDATHDIRHLCGIVVQSTN